MWKGANFKMKIAQVAGFRNYDRSEFGGAEPLNADDSVLEGIYNQQFALKEFTDPTSFKSYIPATVHLSVSGKTKNTYFEKYIFQKLPILKYLFQNTYLEKYLFSKYLL